MTPADEEDEKIRKKAWADMLAAIKQAREEKEEKEKLAAEKAAAGLGTDPEGDEKVS